MKAIQFIVAVLFLAACQSPIKQDPALDSDQDQSDYTSLRKELEEVYDIDQNIRNIDWDTISSPEASIAYSMKMMAVDSVNQTRVIPIIAQYGS